MIELRLKKTSVQMDFSFFAVITVFLLLDQTGFGLSALVVCGVHEMAHLLMMTVFGISAEKILFYGAGIRITSTQTEYARPSIKAAVLLAGCAANFICAAVLFMGEHPSAAAINLFTGIFNLLPIGELDGAGLLKIFAIRFCKPENVDRIMKIAAIVCSVFCAAVIILFGKNFSFTLLSTVIYLIIIGSESI